MDMNTFLSNLNDNEKKILPMINHINNINRYYNNRNILIRYTNSICDNCNINNTSCHSHYYCYNCIINNDNWLNILNTYNNLL